MVGPPIDLARACASASDTQLSALLAAACLQAVMLVYSPILLIALVVRVLMRITLLPLLLETHAYPQACPRMEPATLPFVIREAILDRAPKVRGQAGRTLR